MGILRQNESQRDPLRDLNSILESLQGCNIIAGFERKIIVYLMEFLSGSNSCNEFLSGDIYKLFSRNKTYDICIIT